jgi:hypothetical protein
MMHTPAYRKQMKILLQVVSQRVKQVKQGEQLSEVGLEELAVQLLVLLSVQLQDPLYPLLVPRSVQRWVGLQVTLLEVG